MLRLSNWQLVNNLSNKTPIHPCTEYYFKDWGSSSNRFPVTPNYQDPNLVLS